MCQKGSWSHVFLAETVETGYIYTFCIVMWSTIFSKDVELFWNWLVQEFYRLKALFTLEQVNTVYFSGRKKEESLWAELLQNLHGEADWSGVVNFCCNSMQMSLVMSMLFLSTSYWNDAPCSSCFCTSAIMLFFRIVALDFDVFIHVHSVNSETNHRICYTCTL